MVDNSVFSLNFSFSSNLTKELEFNLNLDQTFLSTKFFNYELTQTNFTNFISVVVVCLNPYVLNGIFKKNLNNNIFIRRNKVLCRQTPFPSFYGPIIRSIANKLKINLSLKKLESERRI